MDIQPNSPLFPQLAPQAPETGQDRNTAEAAATASADFTSFLNLLTAQLRNQDPLQPLDSTEFVAQLASFSTVEQLIGTNERLDRLAGQAETEAAGIYATWIGNSASLTDGSFVAAGEPVSFGFTAEPGADSAVAAVRRADGLAVATIPVDPRIDGEAIWDGTDDAGAPVIGPVSLDVGYFAGEELLAQRAAVVYRDIEGLRGTPGGVVIEFADGGLANPSDVAALRAPAGEED